MQKTKNKATLGKLRRPAVNHKFAVKLNTHIDFCSKIVFPNVFSLFFNEDRTRKKKRRTFSSII